MKKKRTYQAAHIQQVRLEQLLPLLVAGCIVALDVAKQKFVVAFATVQGEVVKLFRFDQPTETPAFLRLVTALCASLGPGKVAAAMEPTGTYGDAVRYQLVEAGVPVWMVSPKRTHDSKEVFDSVPSMHDPKAATVIAKLHALGLSTEWKAPPPTRVRLRALIELRQHEQHRQEVCYGRMEGVLARHWPEVGRWLDVREQKSALHLLAEYASPARVSAEPAAAKSLLREASHGRLSAEAMDGVIAESGRTLGVPMMLEEERLVRTLATEILAAGKVMGELERAMRELAKDDEVFARLAPWMGAFTAAVVVALCDPRQYKTARQMEKACGLNLRENSSGQNDRPLSITKRGPGHVRQVLYLFALRMLQESAAVRAWYERRDGYMEHSRQKAVVAVMRKLVRAAFHVAMGSPFDASKLFDLRRLNLGAPTSGAQSRVSAAAPHEASAEVRAESTAAPREASAEVRVESTAATHEASAEVRVESTAATHEASAEVRVESTAATHEASAEVRVESTAATHEASAEVRVESTAATHEARAEAPRGPRTAAPQETGAEDVRAEARVGSAAATQHARAEAPRDVGSKEEGGATKKLVARTTPRPIARTKKKTVRTMPSQEAGAREKNAAAQKKTGATMPHETRLESAAAKQEASMERATMPKEQEAASKRLHARTTPRPIARNQKRARPDKGSQAST